MGNLGNVFKAIIVTVVVVSLYLSAVFISFEFIYLLIIGIIPPDLFVKPAILSLALFTISIIVKRKFPRNFTKTRVFAALSVCLAVALSLSIFSMIDTSFRNSYTETVAEFERTTDLNIFRNVAFYGMGIFFLLAIPLIYLYSVGMESENYIKIPVLFIVVFIFLVVFYVILGIDKSGWERDLVDFVVKPLTILIIGSLSFGWFRELFINNLDME